jgi:hypothetical protein
MGYLRSLDIVFCRDWRHRRRRGGCGGHCEGRRVLRGTFRGRLLAREEAYVRRVGVRRESVGLRGGCAGEWVVVWKARVRS